MNPLNYKPSGASIGPWNIVRLLGDGSTAKVFLGVHTETKQLAALKVFENTPEVLELIDNEVSLHKLAKHPSIVSVIEFYDQIDYFDARQRPTTVKALAIDFIENGDFLDFIEKYAPIPETIARTFFHQILNAIEFLHSKSIVHRDIKPENFLLDENYSLQLTDFGFAALVKAKDIFFTPAGTISYLSPEIVQNRPYSGKSADLFAAGVILFMMLVGHCPFAKADPNDIYFSPLYQGKTEEFWSTHEDISKKVLGKCSLTADSKELLTVMLNPKPKSRMTLEEIKKNQWYNGQTLNGQGLKKLIKDLQGN